MAMKKLKTSDEVNREYLVELKAQIEREDKTPVCIDCRVWEGTHEVIVLCKLHASAIDILRRALPFMDAGHECLACGEPHNRPHEKDCFVPHMERLAKAERKGGR